MSEVVIQYKIKGIVAVDKRRQFIMSKELRRKAVKNANDKLAIITCQNADGAVLPLIKTEDLGVTYQTKIRHKLPKF
jgi:hypothetical protein